MSLAVSHSPSAIDTALAEILALYENVEGAHALHEPDLSQLERDAVDRCIASSFVSTYGPDTIDLEAELQRFTRAPHVIAVNSGTSALHLSLLASGIDAESEVILSPLGFVATKNAILYTGATPVYLDCEEDGLGLCPQRLAHFLENCQRTAEGLRNPSSGRIVKAVVPVHLFGLAARIRELATICESYGLDLIEDAAEALGCFSAGQHLGTFGRFGILSFNGNKVVTAGGGGAVLCRDPRDAERVLALATTHKKPGDCYPAFVSPAYNYRMPSLNAAMARAQLSRIGDIIGKKESNWKRAKAHFGHSSVAHVITPPQQLQSNYWLTTIKLNGLHSSDICDGLWAKNVGARACWALLSDHNREEWASLFPFASHCYQTVLTLPSGPKLDLRA